MNTRDRKAGTETGKERPAAESSVVNLSDARRAAEGRASVSRAILERDLEESREMLDRGLSGAAEARLRHAVSSARGDRNLQARARCLLSVALEMQGRYTDALEAVKQYESPEARARLDPEVASGLRVQVGLAYNYTGDQPKAIALLNAGLREAEEDGSDVRRGEVYAALARVYRHISEYSIARDFATRALEHFRRTGDWRGLAEAYFSAGLTSTQEGDSEDGLENFEQAAKIVGERPAPYLLGRIYNNMAAALWFLKRPHDGVRALEKAVSFYEGTEHKANAAIGYNNLGINLTLIGEWARAEACLERALELALQLQQDKSPPAMIYDSFGELRMQQGRMDEARDYLERAVALSTEDGNKWYARQALCTLGRCRLALGETELALEAGRGALALAEKIGDRQALCESKLLLAEAGLAAGDAEGCEALLREVTEDTSETTTDIALTGELQRLSGLLALARHDATLAAHHFGRANSIFEMLSDRYRAARAKFLLGRAYSAAQPERAAEFYGLAAHAFRELGAALDLERAEEALADARRSVSEQHEEEPSAPAQLLTLRLAEAAASRELLLRELAAVVQQETRASRILIAE
ncbi:MAG TPA: tetratricopeptide repeat protein, partial [Pyrinomonadaceae bacterium]|nr:tetratricopeptide repeat protein [Pyrinomonadaceae bacterium]